MDSQPLTPEQLSERWQCSKSLVIETINEGKLSAFRLGKKQFRQSYRIGHVRMIRRIQPEDMATRVLSIGKQERLLNNRFTMNQ
nr:hypothetical protein [uncultured Cohaesibacter sp.]